MKRKASLPRSAAERSGEAGGSVRLVAVGSVALDTITTPRDEAREILGGSASYACAAASFFTRVGMVAIVGSDFSREHVETYQRLGIDLRGLQFAEGRTFRWVGAYEEDMNNRRTLRTELNVFEAFWPVLPPAYRRAPFFLLGNISPRLQLHVLAQARAPRFVMADTMDLWITTERAHLDRLIGSVDMLALNETEAHLLTGETALRRAAEKILRQGPRYVVIKKGEHGALLATRSGLFMVPPYLVEEVRDPTGAGDTFAGAFMGALAGQGRATDTAVREALLCASALASFNVEEFGLKRLLEIGPRDVTRRVRQLKRMLQPEV